MHACMYAYTHTYMRDTCKECSGCSQLSHDAHSLLLCYVSGNPSLCVLRVRVRVRVRVP